MKFYQSGRSMVEMLGVLAIIGVLSVGAIAGYSKAMMKYKLNKMSTQYQQIITSMIEYAGQVTPNENNHYITEAYIKLGLIPKDMIKDSYNSIYDVFENKLYITSESAGDTLYCLLEIDNSEQSLAICRQFFIIVKEFHENIYVASSLSNWGNEDSSVSNVFGDKYCTKNNKCLVNISLSDIEKLCSEHINKEGSHLKLRIK